MGIRTEIVVFQASGLRVIRAPRWSFAATFCLSWTAIIVACLLVWAAGISLIF